MVLNPAPLDILKDCLHVVDHGVDFQNKWTDIFLLNGIDDIFAGKNGPRLTVISTSVF